MNGAPDWQDGECCFRCRTQFTLVARKHHCRNCGNIFCAKCSSQQIPLPKLNIEKNVRVCDGCYEKLHDKTEDSFRLALDKEITSSNKARVDTESSTKSNPRFSSSGSMSKSSSGNKPAANASAPSEQDMKDSDQDLKEEEELQLALALSLSEAPTKVSFPDCRKLEEPISVSTPSVSVSSNATNTTNNIAKRSSFTANNDAVVSNHQPHQVAVLQSESNSDLDKYNIHPDKQEIQQQLQLSSTSVQQNYFQLPDEQIQDRDQELFRFVAEVQSTSEVFTNRINSNKLRNRPIANDSAIQSLFLKLTNMHTRLLEYIKVHDEERASYEAIHDKLSQITDARAALDALREEHQEKVRQEAVEAERQRQSQLASKLEMMREKKSQMMQFQREMALQRIQAQEIMLRQQPNQTPYQPQAADQPPVSQAYQTQADLSMQTAYQSVPVTSQAYQLPVSIASSSAGSYQQTLPSVSTSQPYQPMPTSIATSLAYQQAPISVIQSQSFQTVPSVSTASMYQMPPVSNHQQQVLPPPTQHLTHQVPQPPPQPKVDDEAPLISFDD